MSYYRISYNSGAEKGLNIQGIFKYIDNYILYDLRKVQELTEGQNPLDIDIEDEYINDRETAAAYILRFRGMFEYCGGSHTGQLDRVLCVETNEDDHRKETAVLYDHPEHGLIWLDLY